MSSVFPSPWKMSYITPVPKIKNPSVPSDFRPISLLCVLSKILERIVLADLTQYLQRAALTDPYQFGFVTGGSTQAALIKVVDAMRLAIDRREVTVLVLFDFSKAFDTVDHLKLVEKLARLNLSRSTLHWFWSYLTGRSQAVRTSHGLSNWLPVTSRVPQGSVLGPALFSIFAADLNDVVKNSSIVKYADDLQIYAHCQAEHIAECVALINEDVSCISDWADSNFLRLNPAKTQAMILGSARIVNRLEQSVLPQVKVRNDLVPYVNVAKNLGLLITPPLNWREQVTSICNRVFKTLYQLKANGQALTADLRRLLVAALIFPIFNYGSILLLDITGVEDTRLHRALNACVRFVLNVRKYEHITPFYEKLKWLKIAQRRNYFLGAFVYRAIKYRVPAFLAAQLVRRPAASIATRACLNDLCIPAARTTAYQKSALVSATRLWNSLPPAMRDLPTIGSFNRALFEFLRAA